MHYNELDIASRPTRSHPGFQVLADAHVHSAALVKPSILVHMKKTIN